MESIQDYLNSLWSGVIEKHVFDLFNHCILFDIKVVDKGKTIQHQLKFTNVKSFYYLNDQIPFEPEYDDYLELTSISFQNEKNKVIKVSSYLNEHPHLATNINFSLEIWGRELFIEASSIEIDGKLFHVGFSK
ncbi:hypothetical protein GCM10008014_36820 [Paenibacillus silvae]|uniref:Uncharacterized protein n=1 Tax=Paenibacillus silvae TaxID=1325358 RepID=A0ABQ1ZGH9_9BACL|nr:hypothetical protein [Paenibacillus silvae]GGH61408.1 hypothetical protein GCM10008014_36820 [Paenibacillus silvae]